MPPFSTVLFYVIIRCKVEDALNLPVKIGTAHTHDVGELRDAEITVGEVLGYSLLELSDEFLIHLT